MIVNQKLVFNYNMKNLIVFPEKSFCVLDKYRYDLLAPAIVRDQVLYMGLADLKRIYSPEKVLPDTFPGAIRENGTLDGRQCSMKEHAVDFAGNLLDRLRRTGEAHESRSRTLLRAIAK